jgi:hypothetical protein
VGSTKKSSAHILQRIAQEINNLCGNRDSVTLFGNPVTKDGLHLMKRHKFKCVCDDSSPKLNAICKVVWTKGH